MHRIDQNNRPIISGKVPMWTNGIAHVPINYK